jgi:hypothetical protein
MEDAASKDLPQTLKGLEKNEVEMQPMSMFAIDPGWQNFGYADGVGEIEPGKILITLDEERMGVAALHPMPNKNVPFDEDVFFFNLDVLTHKLFPHADSMMSHAVLIEKQFIKPNESGPLKALRSIELGTRGFLQGKYKVSYIDHISPLTAGKILKLPKHTSREDKKKKTMAFLNDLCGRSPTPQYEFKNDHVADCILLMIHFMKQQYFIRYKTEPSIRIFVKTREPAKK